jgi:hypothetical protein
MDGEEKRLRLKPRPFEYRRAAVRADQLSMQPRLQSSRLRDNPSELSSTLTAGTKAVALLGIACRCA